MTVRTGELTADQIAVARFARAKAAGIVAAIERLGHEVQNKDPSHLMAIDYNELAYLVGTLPLPRWASPPTVGYWVGDKLKGEGTTGGSYQKYAEYLVYCMQVIKILDALLLDAASKGGTA